MCDLKDKSWSSQKPNYYCWTRSRFPLSKVNKCASVGSITQNGFFSGMYRMFTQHVHRDAFICMQEWRSLRRAITTGSIHLVGSHCSSLLMQAEPREQETVMDNGPSFSKNDRLLYSRLYCLDNSLKCQQPHFAFTVKSSVYCLWFCRDLQY